MPDQLDVAVIGAGPFGLSVAAHLRHLDTRVFGAQMKTWRTCMPPDMKLRSSWHSTSMSAPADAGTIDAFIAETGEPREEPIPLQKFLRYADWFEDRFVRESDPADVARLEHGPGGFRLTTTAGDEVDARRVVVAVGVTPFSYAPPPFDAVLGADVRFAIERPHYEDVAGGRVVVVGGGQGGLEAAAMAARAGARTEMLIRSHLRWFADREPYRPRGPWQERIYNVAYPVVGYGPPGLNRFVVHPDLFAAAPARMKVAVSRRILRAGGSPWVRDQVEGKVQITEGRAVTAVERSGGAMRLTLDDGSTREADAVVLATGFRFSLERLGFLSPQLRRAVAVDDGWPVIDHWFRSRTLPELQFVGYAAERRFGPAARFVGGADFSARRAQAVHAGDGPSRGALLDRAALRLAGAARSR